MANVAATVTAATQLDADAAHGLVAGGSGAAALTVVAVEPAGHAAVAVGATPLVLGGQYGTLTVHADGSYSYSADHAAALAAGETAVDTFAFTVVDGGGHTASASLALTVTGVDDAPTVTGALSAAAQAGGKPLVVNLLSGASDVDHGHVLAVADLSYAVNGAAATHTPPGGVGVAGAVLTLDPAAFHLAPGRSETLVVGYDIVDLHGEQVHQSLTVTVSAPETAPVLAPDAGVHALTETPGTTGGAARLSAAATLHFTDADAGDAHTAHVALSQAVWSGGTTLPAGLADALAADVSASLTEPDASGAGAIQIAFAPSEAAFDFLAAGETLRATYTASVIDAAGAVSSQPVTILVTGTNDAPVFDGAPVTTGSIAASGAGAVEHAAGSLHFTDPDLSDRPTASISNQTIAAVDASGHAFALTGAQTAAVEHGLTLAAAGTNTGTVAWSYDLSDSAFAFLAAGQDLTLTSTIAVDDHHGGLATQDVSVHIAGPAPVSTALAALPDIDGVARGGTVSADAAHGLLANDAVGGSQAGLSVTAVDGNALPVPGLLSEILPLPTLGRYGDLTVHADGSYSYHAYPGLPFVDQGTVQDVFAYTVSDGHGHSDTSTLTVTVTDAGVAYVRPSGTEDGSAHTLVGTTGRQVLDGGDGNDRLVAGTGPTVLIGGPGNDDMTGGCGADTFLFAAGFGHDVVHGFDVGRDILQFDHAAFGSAAAVLQGAVGFQNGVVITDGAGDAVTLIGVTRQALLAHADDIHIV